MASWKIMSADDHVFEPPDLWTSRIESKFKDRAPRIVRIEDGSDWWMCEDLMAMPMVAGSETGVRLEAPEKMSMQDVFENVRPGGYLPEERLKDMDVDGVEASIIYPTVGLSLFGLIQDSELLTSIWKSYNDWLGEFCKQYPQRLKGIALLNVDDVQVGIKELERCTKLGFVGALITVYPPEDKAYYSPEYEPLWAAAQDLGIPLSLHSFTNRLDASQESSKVSLFRPTPTYQCNSDHWVRMSLGDIIFSGVFERYPNLQVGSVEQELSWVPFFVDRLDYNYTQQAKRDHWYTFKEGMLPSDYFHRNVFLGFQEDPLGIRLRDIIGVDQLQWGSDYPHHNSTWPKSRQILEKILVDCTDEEKAKIAGGNAARIYNID